MFSRRPKALRSPSGNCLNSVGRGSKTQGLLQMFMWKPPTGSGWSAPTRALQTPSLPLIMIIIIPILCHPADFQLCLPSTHLFHMLRRDALGRLSYAIHPGWVMPSFPMIPKTTDFFPDDREKKVMSFASLFSLPIPKLSNLPTAILLTSTSLPISETLLCPRNKQQYDNWQHSLQLPEETSLLASRITLRRALSDPLPSSYVHKIGLGNFLLYLLYLNYEY